MSMLCFLLGLLIYLGFEKGRIQMDADSGFRIKSGIPFQM